ncbi:MAG: formylmethanofuran dehydrogenase subunit E family protein [Candidatus Bathyarchaeia archaeon]
MRKNKGNLDSVIKRARELHGHLGPFLVIGVKIGEFAKETLNGKMEALVKVPMATPFSCVIDGVQASTQCTVGNRRLLLENSEKEITIHFKLQGSKKMLRIYVNQQLVEELKQKLLQGVPDEELAWKVAQMPKNSIFTWKINK